MIYDENDKHLSKPQDTNCMHNLPYTAHKLQKVLQMFTKCINACCFLV